MMLIGRDLRKAISQATASGLFRWIAVWVLVGACASYGHPIGTVGAIVIIAMDIITCSHARAISFANGIQHRKEWSDTLTDRIFYRLFWEQLRQDGPKNIDIETLFREASREAERDVQKADEESKLESRWFDSIAWRFFEGIMSFEGQILGYCAYYGSALYIFQKISRP